MFPSNVSFLKGEDTGVRKLLKTYQYQIRLYNNLKTVKENDKRIVLSLCDFVIWNRAHTTLRMSPVLCTAPPSHINPKVCPAHCTTWTTYFYHWIFSQMSGEAMASFQTLMRFSLLKPTISFLWLLGPSFSSHLCSFNPVQWVRMVPHSVWFSGDCLWCPPEWCIFLLDDSQALFWLKRSPKQNWENPKP